MVFAGIVVEGIAISLLAMFLLGAYHEIARLEALIRVGPASQKPPASKLSVGEELPIDFGVPIPPRMFLLVVSYGCGGCVQVSRELDQLGQLDGWELFVLMKGNPINLTEIAAKHPLPPGMQLDGGFAQPSFSRVFHAGNNTWIRDLEATVTPAALAFVGGKLVDQEVSPSVDWFRQVATRRSIAGKRLLTARSEA